jgi:hypothetical protein
VDSLAGGPKNFLTELLRCLSPGPFGWLAPPSLLGSREPTLSWNHYTNYGRDSRYQPTIRVRRPFAHCSSATTDRLIAEYSLGFPPHLAACHRGFHRLRFRPAEKRRGRSSYGVLKICPVKSATKLSLAPTAIGCSPAGYQLLLSAVLVPRKFAFPV